MEIEFEIRFAWEPPPSSGGSGGLPTLKGNFINLRIYFCFSKEKMRFRTETQISTTKGKAE
ncbi:MAG: hypothetical protein LUD82_02570, partial [Clostridiales bacterium]|nr:hypothetical protein [Clostridiales bacterium]